MVALQKRTNILQILLEEHFEGKVANSLLWSNLTCQETLSAAEGEYPSELIIVEPNLWHKLTPSSNHSIYHILIRPCSDPCPPFPCRRRPSWLWKLSRKSQSIVLCHWFAGFRCPFLTLKLTAGPVIFVLISVQDKNLWVKASTDKVTKDLQSGLSSEVVKLNWSWVSLDNILCIRKSFALLLLNL